MTRFIEQKEELLAALDRGESIPAYWYTDTSVTEREIRQILRKSWSYIGPLQELAKVGDYITGYVGEIPVLVVRNENGLKGFINVCRHRRHEVMKDRGNAKIMQCKYHAWTYDLAGCLRGAPRSATEPNFRFEDYPLLSLRTEALGPFVFVNADLNGPSVQSCFGEVLDIIAASGLNLEGLELYRREEWQSNANWKTLLENYLECYHCAVAHPGFSAAIDVKPENYNLTSHEWFSSQVAPVRQTALEGKSKIKTYDVRGDVEQAQYHFLWPNFTINVKPGISERHGRRLGSGWSKQIERFSELYYGPGVSQQFAEELIAFNNQAVAEDNQLTDSVQRGLLGGMPERGRFLVNSEHLVGHFQKLVVNALMQGVE